MSFADVRNSHDMTLSLHDLEFLASPDGAHLLDSLADEDLSDSRTLALLTKLRKTYTPEQAGAALELARLRKAGVTKFGENAARLYFTRDALEQASDPLIRRYRASQIEGGGTIYDLCCGIGADALAFAQYALDSEVIGLDLDPLRVEMARHNTAALGLNNVRFEVGDVREFTPSLTSPLNPLSMFGEGTFQPPIERGFRQGMRLIFFDPARRDSNGKRIYDVERYIPPLSLVKTWAETGVLIMVKLSPGVELAQLRPYLENYGGGGRVEFISVGGDLKEAVLHLNKPTKIAYPYSATLLGVSDYPLHWRRTSAPELRLSEPRGWLCEPDPAIIRAGLVRDMGEVIDGTQLDESIAYLTTDSQPDLPWLRAWQILDWMPFNLKKLRAYLRELGVGHLTVKKRGSPIEPEALIAQLKLKEGGESRTLVLTQLQGQPIVLICADYVSTL